MRALIDDKILRVAEKPHDIAVYTVLCLLACGSTRCTATVGKIGILAHAGRTITREAIARLIEAGMIKVLERQHADGGKAANTYVIEAYKGWRL